MVMQSNDKKCGSAKVWQAALSVYSSQFSLDIMVYCQFEVLGVSIKNINF